MLLFLLRFNVVLIWCHRLAAPGCYVAYPFTTPSLAGQIGVFPLSSRDIFEALPSGVEPLRRANLSSQSSGSPVPEDRWWKFWKINQVVRSERHILRSVEQTLGLLGQASVF